MAARRDGGHEVARILVGIPGPLAGMVALALGHGINVPRVTPTLDEAIAALNDWRPHLVMIDLDLGADLIDHVPRSADGARRPPLIGFMRERDLGVKLQAHERGVEDIIQAPFTPDEIVGRAVIVMSRVHGSFMPLIPAISLGAVNVDIFNQMARVGSAAAKLSPTEHSLLYLLAAHAGRPLQYAEILDNVWGQLSPVRGQVLEQHIRDLRSKLGDDGPTRMIERIGHSYLFRGADPLGVLS
jgi:two-component system, OmpR family, KDP operon response regulator KdpE